ncbi:esterase [Peribacillus saganii]|uniref:Esterase n=2 Tax=Peribacillus saganii TaxID=2303992 RepID=A0A372LP22_9BACI|nr:esterase [Peribacillus saganii]
MIYELQRPSQFEPNKTYPALFVMHGMGSKEKNMLSIVDGLEEKFFIFSIRGHLSQPPGFAFFTIQGYGKPHKEVFDEGIRRLISFIDYATEQYPLDQGKLYLLGFSQGAIVSMTIGLTIARRIRGIIALSGYIPGFVKDNNDVKSINQLSLFISHGEMDNILPFEWGLESSEFFRRLGSNVTFQSYPEGHTISLKNQLDFTKWLLQDLEK